MAISDDNVSLVSNVLVILTSTSVLKFDGDKRDSKVLGFTVAIGVLSLDTSVDERRCVGTGLMIELMTSVATIEVVNDVSICILHSTALVVVLRAKEQDSGELYQLFALVLIVKCK